MAYRGRVLDGAAEPRAFIAEICGFIRMVTLLLHCHTNLDRRKARDYPKLQNAVW
jgi:hypothetical protein